MPVRLLGFFFLAVGAGLGFGAYRDFSSPPIETLSIVLVPVFQLLAGAGLLDVSPKARALAFFICCFHLILGALVFFGGWSWADFIPVEPVLEFLPRIPMVLPPGLVPGICLFFLPALVALVLNLKAVGYYFERGLRGYFAWYAPFAVVLAGGFGFSYGLLALSETSLVFGYSERTLFGYHLGVIPTRIVNGLEFLLPLMVAFDLLTGKRSAWYLGLAYAAYYWTGYLLEGGVSSVWRDFRFTFFGIGWLFVSLSLLFHWSFFWKQDEWLAKRLAGRSNWLWPVVFWSLAASALALAVAYTMSKQAATRYREKNVRAFWLEQTPEV